MPRLRFPANACFHQVFASIYCISRKRPGLVLWIYDFGNSLHVGLPVLALGFSHLNKSSTCGAVSGSKKW